MLNSMCSFELNSVLLGYAHLWPTFLRLWQEKIRTFHNAISILPSLHPQHLAMARSKHQYKSVLSSGPALSILLHIGKCSFSCSTEFLEMPLTSHCSSCPTPKSSGLKVLLSALALPTRMKRSPGAFWSKKKSYLASWRKGEKCPSKSTEILELANTFTFFLES